MGPNAWTASALALVLLLGIGLLPYGIAYWKTGDPVFPFLAAKFHPPLINPPEDFQDLRFLEPVTPTLLYNLTFHTSRSYEGQDGSFGFQYLVAVPLALLGLLVAARRPATSAAAVALGAAVVILFTQPNVRYLYMSMILVMVPLAALLGWMLANQRWLYRVLVVCLIAATALNAYFLPASSWYHKDFSMRLPFSRSQHRTYLRENAPIRDVIAWFNLHHPNTPVLTTGEESEIAGLDGPIYENHWHQWPTVSQLQRALTPNDVLALMHRWNIQYFIAHKRAPGDLAEPASLQSLLDICTSPEYVVGDRYLAHLAPDCEQILATVGPGTYDDVASVVQYRGEWTHDTNFKEAYHDTVTYTASPGSEASLTFKGTAVTYVYTKAFNRGKAEIMIDGNSAGTLDLFSPKIEWQMKTRFCCYSPARHVIVIRVTGESAHASKGQFVDVDSFLVE
jgi:hypothetical protein